MARVKALTKCFVDNTIRNEGEEFEYNGTENGNLEELEPAKAPESTKAKEKK